MYVEQVEAIPLRRDLDERFANAQKWIDSREYCLVRITADDGSVGWGECWGPVAGNREIVERTVGPWLTGRDPRDVEAIHDELIVRLRSSYHSYVPASVVSGVDIALWDLYGKALGEPISRLLGGRERERVRAYATGHFWGDVDSFDDLRDAVVAEATGHVEAGFDALKNKIGLARHFPWGPEEDVALVRAIREAVGDDVRLMTDANHAYDVADARRVGRALADLDVHFFEEPIPPAGIERYARLNDQLAVPLAGGECWAFRDEFDRVLDAGAVDYVQPDVTSAGGVTSTRRVATMAEAADVQCLPHVFGSAVALAASLQVLATIRGDPMLEFDRTPNPIREGLAVDPITNDGNSVPIPDAPGLGIEVDEETLAAFRLD
ncbi:mandelate racemase/muconate lactonizing enzyme family protein [Halomarina pelagica]|uniref:mandelate racemase/muconate lactonizing enzyme family protein n=1 Tax=Halomarina pelagica TaxID=2961599 RepID=UPI0020C3EE4D|nr:mandelate racemase/muconate lactonizing enzyme family protein [Halomarina sp. BND7]